MNESVQRQGADPEVHARLRQQGEAALTAIGRALTVAPVQCLKPVDDAERALAGLRDGLIDLLRQATSDRAQRNLRSALDRVNGALSLVLGVEYPAVGVQQDLLKEARKNLQAVLSGPVLSAN
jgi:hypothetical protein